MERSKGFRAHSPYEAPEAEVLEIRIEERFLDTYNGDNNNKPTDGGGYDFGD